MFETLIQDIKFGLRMLLKNPGFASVAVITLALGIGANAAIFSVIYGVLLRPLPYTNGAQMMVCHQAAPLAHVNNLNFTPKEVMDYRALNKTMTAVAEHHSMTFILYGRDEQGPGCKLVWSITISLICWGVITNPWTHIYRTGSGSNADAVIMLTYKILEEPRQRQRHRWQIIPDE